MQVTVKLFGAVREAAGAKDLSVMLPEGARVADLRALLAARIPLVDRYGARLMTSVNLCAVQQDHMLRDGDEVALLPPVSGGSAGSGAARSGSCTLSERPLDVGAVMARVQGPGMGGIVSFVGTVRDHARGRAVQHLEYEAYAPMAEREMDAIAEEAAQRLPGARVAMAHRVGHLEVGEIAVVVVAAAPHRPEAFAACRFAIDALKQRVPIWKKELTVDGASWVEDHA